jgi:hypothetical protein
MGNTVSSDEAYLKLNDKGSEIVSAIGSHFSTRNVYAARPYGVIRDGEWFACGIDDYVLRPGYFVLGGLDEFGFIGSPEPGSPIPLSLVEPFRKGDAIVVVRGAGPSSLLHYGPSDSFNHVRNLIRRKGLAVDLSAVEERAMSDPQTRSYMEQYGLAANR